MSSEDGQFERRILVIDDNPAIHEDFRKILNPAFPALAGEIGQMAAALFGKEAEGRPASGVPRYQMDSANQGQQGLAMVEAALAAGRPYHMAFVDIRMPPGWDGIETIEHLWKADPKLQTVICSAHSDYTWADIRSRLGESDRLLILKKPFDTAEISQLAASLTEKYRLAELAFLKCQELEERVHLRTQELQSANDQLRIEVAQRREAENQLRHDVLHDRLTGLPNRALLIDRIEHCIRRQERDPTCRFAVLFMDIDDFKVINDSLGHEAGDKLLVGVAERLSATVRGVDLTTRISEGVPSRLGGDEFVILLEGLVRYEDACIVAQRIEEALATPFEVDGYEVVCNLSIGIADSSIAYTNAADILRDADTAVYRAKAHCKHSFAVFDTQMHAEARSRLEMESDLHKAVGTDQLTQVYQPIINLRDGHLVGFEALVRWNHPRHGMIGPGRFIPVAESTGLIAPLEMQVLRGVSMNLARWRKQFPQFADLWISVNLSGKHLRRPGVPDQIEQVFEEFGLDRRALRLEITESVLMQQGDMALSNLTSLWSREILLTLDDFGTGYSSLSQLHQLPIGTLKIDQSFVRKLGINQRRYTATVQAIVMLGQNCGFSVVAEGIETEAQLTQLQALDCDLGQGFLISRPISSAQVEEILGNDPRFLASRVALRKAS